MAMSAFKRELTTRYIPKNRIRKENVWLFLCLNMYIPMRTINTKGNTFTKLKIVKILIIEIKKTEGISERGRIEKSAFFPKTVKPIGIKEIIAKIPAVIKYFEMIIPFLISCLVFNINIWVSHRVGKINIHVK